MYPVGKVRRVAAFFVPKNKNKFKINTADICRKINNRNETGRMMLGLFKKWWRRKEGSTAIEFSLLFVPYMVLSLGIIEVSLMYASASLLEGATDSAARLIRTGQLQQSGSQDPEGDFREAMCDYATVLVKCEDVIIEVIPLDSYADYSDPVYGANGNVVPQGFDAGGANQRVLVRTAYRYNMITPIVGTLLGGADGSIQFISTIVLQSEPYEFQGA